MAGEELFTKIENKETEAIPLDNGIYPDSVVFDRSVLPEIEDKNFENFLEGLNLGKVLSEELVFYSSTTHLNNVMSISQHILPNRWISTTIGESHTDTWDCPSPNISLSEYIADRVQKNSNCLVLLEYDNVIIEKGVARIKTDYEISQIESESLKDIYTTLERMGMTNKIYPYDRRSRMLGNSENGILYYKLFSEFFKDVTKNEAKGYIINFFIEPYFDGADSGWFNLPECLEAELCDQLGKINTDIENEFLQIMMQLNSKSLNIIQQQLQIVWQKVVDFLVLREMYSRTNINEYIFVGGDIHNRFLISKLEEVTRQVYLEKGEVGDCINLYHTYKFK